MGVKQSKHVDISTNPKKNGELKSVDDKITVTHFHGLHVIFSAHFVHLEIFDMNLARPCVRLTTL